MHSHPDKRLDVSNLISHLKLIKYQNLVQLNKKSTVAFGTTLMIIGGITISILILGIIYKVKIACQPHQIERPVANVRPRYVRARYVPNIDDTE